MKNKRGTDHTWTLIQYKGDAAIYAKCKCGYHYNCSRWEKQSDYFRITPAVFYLYCPSCGARKKYYTEIEKSEKWIGDVKFGGTAYDISEKFINKEE